MLVLLPFSMGAQEVDQSVEKRIDSLATEVTTLDKVVQKLSKFNVSAYIQGQYQYGQEDATLKVGDKNENLDKGFNRIGIRRGRMKFEYNDGIGTGAVQIEVNDKGVSFRDLYIGIKDPWTKRSQLMAGVFNRPFGYEVCYSTSSLESPERATIIQYFFPDERDLGAMLTLRTKTTSPLSFLRWMPVCLPETVSTGRRIAGKIHRASGCREGDRRLGKMGSRFLLLPWFCLQPDYRGV